MNLRNSLLRGLAPAVTALALAAIVSTSAHAASIALTPNQSGQLGYGGTTAPNFTNTLTSGTLGYNFVYTNIASAKAGANGVYAGVALDAATVADPNCLTCSLLALDGDFETSAVNVSLTGLLANTTYVLTFDFAGDQQLYSLNGTVYGSCGNSGTVLCNTPFDSGINVSANGTSIGNASEGTAVLIPAQGFGGWQAESFDFTTGSSSSETLSFLGSGLTQNVPSFALVDDLNVSVAPPAPEPNSLILLGTGLAGLGGLVRSRFVKATTKA